MPLAFITLTLLLFGQTMLFDFVSFDDNILVFSNPAVQTFNLRSIAWFLPTSIRSSTFH